MTLDFSPTSKFTRDGLSEDQTEKLAAIERFKKIFLSTSSSGYAACRELLDCEELLEKCKANLPEVKNFPSAIEVGVVLERAAHILKNVLTKEMAKASTPDNWLCLGDVNMGGALSSSPPPPVDDIEEDDIYSGGGDLSFVPDLSLFLEHYIDKREKAMRFTCPGAHIFNRVAHDVNFKAVFGEALSKDLFRLREVGTSETLTLNAAIKRISEHVYFTEEHFQRILPVYSGIAKSLFDDEDGIEKMFKECTGNVSLLHSKLKDLRVREAIVSSNLMFDQPLGMISKSLVSSLASPIEAYDRFKNEMVLGRIESERSVALSIALQMLPNGWWCQKADYVKPIDTAQRVDQLFTRAERRSSADIVDGLIARAEDRLSDATKSWCKPMPFFDGLPPILMNRITESEERDLGSKKYFLRALKLNKGWLASHLGEHFLGEEYLDPRESSA